MVEDLSQPHVVAEDVACAGHDARGQQRVSAEREEILVDADTIDAQRVCPDSREQFLDGRSRWTSSRRALGRGRLRQRAPIDLTAARQRERVDRDEHRRHHEGGQRLFEVAS